MRTWKYRMYYNSEVNPPIVDVIPPPPPPNRKKGTSTTQTILGHGVITKVNINAADKN